jgi:PPE-repeat protein
MNYMIRFFFILIAACFFTKSTHAQQLTNVFVSQDGKASYRFAINNIYLVLSEKGKLLEIKTDANGTIVYNVSKRVEQIGDVKIGFNYQGLVNNIGSASVLYDFSGRVDRIGNIAFRYNYNGFISEVGNQKVMYSADNRIDQFDQFRITYNYNKLVQRIDDSKGLIVLQLNYDK